MQTITIQILNPKAVKLINDLADLELISINENSTTLQWFDDSDFLEELNEDLVKYNNGELKTYTWEQVMQTLSERKLNR